MTETVRRSSSRLSGGYPAGPLWPPVFERAVAGLGWRQTMLCYTIAEIVVIVTLVTFHFPPELSHQTTAFLAGDRQSTCLASRAMSSSR